MFIKLTATDGNVLYINASAIEAITPEEADDGTSATCVVGSRAMYSVTETPEEIMALIPLAH